MEAELVEECYDASMQSLWLIGIAAAYLSGSIPFALLLGYVHGVDIRQQGSGNVGATNCGRILGRRWGALCLGLDAVKGFLPVLLMGWALGFVGREHLPPVDAWRWLAIAVAAVLGHVFPIWLRFRGGKGVATGLGVLLGFWPILTIPAIVAVLIFAVMVVTFRYISLASLVAAAAIPVVLAVRTAIAGVSTVQVLPFLLVTAALAMLVIVRHRTNIIRLFYGTESKIGGVTTRESGV